MLAARSGPSVLPCFSGISAFCGSTEYVCQVPRRAEQISWRFAVPECRRAARLAPRPCCSGSTQSPTSTAVTLLPRSITSATPSLPAINGGLGLQA